VTEFVNADAIASGLSAFNVEGAAMAAGRIMLQRLKALARKRASFAFETTLSSRSFSRWLADLQRDGYAVHMVFLWLSSAELAVQRVADRVAMGGHSVPEETVRRRYRTGLRNFLTLYQDRTTTWSLFDSSRPQLRLIAEHLANGTLHVYDRDTWKRISDHSDED
jgi:predicted ABC-type ATPase